MSGFGYHTLRAGLTRRVSTALARAIDSYSRKDTDDLREQHDIIEDIASTHGTVLAEVLEALEVDRFLKMFAKELN